MKKIILLFYIATCVYEFCFSQCFPNFHSNSKPKTFSNVYANWAWTPSANEGYYLLYPNKDFCEFTNGNYNGVPIILS